MTEELLAILIEDHARFPMALYSIFQGSDLEKLRHRETAERWSPLEILAHLRDEEREDFRPRVRAAVEGRELTFGLEPERWAKERRYNEMDPGAVYLDWSKERAESCRWLATLTRADLERTVEHPDLGTFRAGDFLTAWRIHDLLHLKQFARALAASWGAELADWRLEYAGKVPGR